MASESVGWRFDNTYARLPAALHVPATPVAVRAPRVAVLNHPLAAELGLNLDAMTADEQAATFTGQTLPPGAEPIAQAYAGHQFGGFAMLGDGRAILLGEHLTPAGRRTDVQLKGAGPTRFSRGGDGRAAVGPMLREYIISESLAALGVPTTRSLAVALTGEPVLRETPRRGAVLTRLAASHIRVGTFEYASARRDEPTLRALADYAIARHDPDLTDAPGKYLAFFRRVLGRQAALVAKWQQIGFVHGVLNTDNVAVSGEAIDFGPCAFLNRFDPATVFSSIDRGGRYAFGQQPAITQWNLARFAESLLPLIDADAEQAVAVATEALGEFPAEFERHMGAGMRAKLGLTTEQAGDEGLVNELLAWMHATAADWTNTFRDLSAEGEPDGEAYRQPAFRAWYAKWRARQTSEGRSLEEVTAEIRTTNPAVIPRNHKVEEALTAAEAGDDFGPFLRLLAAVQSPFTLTPESAAFTVPPADDSGYRTFCGT